MNNSSNLADCITEHASFEGNHKTLKTEYSGHPLSRIPTGPAKKFEKANVRDSGKFKILALYKALGKPNTVFTSVLTLVSLKGNSREKIYWYFYSNWYFILSAANIS